MVTSPVPATSSSRFLPRLYRLFLLIVLAATLPASPSWGTEPPSPDLTGRLCPLLPDLEKALQYYQELADGGEWPMVPTGPTLHEGELGPRISLLRARLVAGGDLAEATAEGEERFDAPLAAAVRSFQDRHGLKADGVVGAATLAALNVPIGERLRQLRVNLLRCQPLPETLGARFIFVNIADFSLQLFEEGRPVLSMPVIVGKTYRQTPVLNSIVSVVVVNPSWEVPYTIARKDILAHIRKEPDYLQQHNFRVFRGWSKDSEELDPAEIDWSNLSAKKFPFRLRQEPGAANALGTLKFLFPNEHDVYLHDTPARELFRRESRTFSSGCIRIARPLDLAVHLLRGTPLGEAEALNAAIAGGKTMQVRTPSPIAVHVVYMTAWVDTDGVLQFRPDIYSRDGAPGSATP